MDAERRVDERLVELTVRSPALGSHLTVALLTPRGWDRRGPADRWPVLYLLAGGDGDHTLWTTVARAQEIPGLRDMLVVMPSMPVFGFWTNWWNRGAGGPPQVETYLLREVVPLLEARYGAGGRRVAAGESQGGFGALSCAARHPGLFRAAAAFGAPFHPLLHPDLWLAGGRLLGVDVEAMWGDPTRQRHLWQAVDPYFHVGALRHTPLYLASGDGTPGPLDSDEPEVFIPGTEHYVEVLPDNVISVTEALCGFEAEALTRRLRAVGAPVTLHRYPGTHTGTYVHRELRHALPLLLRAAGV